MACEQDRLNSAEFSENGKVVCGETGCPFWAMGVCVDEQVIRNVQKRENTFRTVRTINGAQNICKKQHGSV